MKVVETKFEIGQEVFFMSGNEPKKGKIEGIKIYYGKVYNSSYNILNLNDGECAVKYSIGFEEQSENDLYTSKDLMIETLFKDI